MPASGGIKDKRGICPGTVAQIFRRATDRRLTFRYHDGRRYRSAASLVGHDNGWPTTEAAEKAARGFGIKHTVDISDDWDSRGAA